MTKTTLTDGSPVTPDHRTIDPVTGQQKGYVVLSAEERAKGFVRPVRNAYVHRGGCGDTTTMGRALAETYAANPGFYSGTFCANCHRHFPVNQFVWKGTDEELGSDLPEQKDPLPTSKEVVYCGWQPPHCVPTDGREFEYVVTGNVGIWLGSISGEKRRDPNMLAWRWPTDSKEAWTAKQASKQ